MFLLIILFTKTGREWNKSPTQDKCLKLLHAGYRGKENKGNTKKREQKHRRIGSVMVPRGSIFVHSILNAEHALYTTLTLFPTKSVAEL